MSDKPLNDSLSDLFKSAADTSAPSKPVVTAPSSYTPILERVFSEPCPKCRGTGRFVSYAGRDCGPCFTCKGNGQRTFKSAPEQRAKARAQSATRKATTAESNVADFAIANPAEWQWIDGNTFGFAVAMRAAIERFGYLTDNQLAAVSKCLLAREQATQERKDRVANAPVVSVERIERAFSQARASGLQRLKLRLDAFEFFPARATSANAGVLYVKEGGTYLGKIMGGKFMASRDCSAEQSARIVAVASNPESAAVAYGKRLGQCSCCGRELSDPESVARGIGPICAANWGL